MKKKKFKLKFVECVLFAEKMGRLIKGVKAGED